MQQFTRHGFAGYNEFARIIKLEIYRKRSFRLAFYQKYRPKTFSDLIGEDHIRATLVEAVKSDSLSHAYLLCGPRGTGKTSTARLLAKTFNCETLLSDKRAGKEVSGEPCNKCQSCLDVSAGRAVDVIEIDAASHTKVDEIREVIDQANFVPTRSYRKVYIIDEVHMLSNSSFNALLKTLEEPPAHVIFILATTEVHKLPATILSRTQRFDFRRVTKEDIVINLKNIAKNEKIEIDDDSLEMIALSAEGGHRDAIGLLEQVASFSSKITKDTVEDILGIAKSEEVFGFVGAIFNEIPEEGLKIAHRLFSGGANMTQFNKGIIECLRKILLVKMSGQALFDDTAENIEKSKKLAEQIDERRLVFIIEIFIKAGQLLKDISLPVLPIEMAVVESCVHDSTTNSKFEIRNSKQIPNSKTQNQNDQKININTDSLPKAQNDNKEIPEEKKAADAVVPEKVAHKDDNIEKKDVAVNKIEISPVASEEKETATIAVFQMTDDLWERVIDEAKKENSTLAALLRDAKPLEVSGNKVKLGVRFAFHKDRISEPANLSFLENIFSEIVGQKCIIGCEVSKPKKKSGEGEDLVKAAEEIFS